MEDDQNVAGLVKGMRNTSDEGPNISMHARKKEA
jgi:hypothetical protein